VPATGGTAPRISAAMARKMGSQACEITQ
jgi:hypothetical protein